MDATKTGNEKAKVLPFRNNADYPIFTPSLRKKMEEGVGGLTEKPVETVVAFEQVICTAIITFFRQWATNLGRKAGSKLGGAIASNE